MAQGSVLKLLSEKDLDSNPDTRTNKLGDLGQVTQTLSLNFFISKMGLVTGLFHNCCRNINEAQIHVKCECSATHAGDLDICELLSLPRFLRSWSCGTCISDLSYSLFPGPGSSSILSMCQNRSPHI